MYPGEDTMKRMSFAITAALMIVAVGSSVADSKDEKLKVTAPGDVTLKPGEAKEISVGVTRPDSDDEVTVKVEDLPKGVTVDRSSVKVKKGDKKAAFVLKIDEKDVKEVENHKAKVTATHKGTTVKETFNVTVKKK